MTRPLRHFLALLAAIACIAVVPLSLCGASRPEQKREIVVATPVVTSEELDKKVRACARAQELDVIAETVYAGRLGRGPFFCRLPSEIIRHILSFVDRAASKVQLPQRLVPLEMGIKTLITIGPGEAVYHWAENLTSAMVTARLQHVSSAVRSAFASRFHFSPSMQAKLGMYEYVDMAMRKAYPAEKAPCLMDRWNPSVRVSDGFTVGFDTNGGVTRKTIKGQEGWRAVQTHLHDYCGQVYAVRSRGASDQCGIRDGQPRRMVASRERSALGAGEVVWRGYFEHHIESRSYLDTSECQIIPLGFAADDANVIVAWDTRDNEFGCLDMSSAEFTPVYSLAKVDKSNVVGCSLASHSTLAAVCDNYATLNVLDPRFVTRRCALSLPKLDRQNLEGFGFRWSAESDLESVLIMQWDYADIYGVVPDTSARGMRQAKISALGRLLTVDSREVYGPCDCPIL